MRVMMPETSSMGAAVAARVLREAGHDVYTCHESDDRGFACGALRGRPCPLEEVPIDVAVDVRPYGLPMPRLNEEGVRCAARRHIPLVVAGAVEHNPFRDWTTAEQAGVEVVAAAEAAAATPLTEPTTCWRFVHLH